MKCSAMDSGMVTDWLTATETGSDWGMVKGLAMVMGMGGARVKVMETVMDWATAKVRVKDLEMGWERETAMAMGSVTETDWVKGLATVLPTRPHSGQRPRPDGPTHNYYPGRRSSIA